MRSLPHPDDLTLPGPGSRTVRDLLSLGLARSRAVALGLGAGVLPPGDPRGVLRRALPALVAAHPGFLPAALLQPSRMTLARCLEFSATAEQSVGWGQELAALLLLDAAEAGLLPARVEARWGGGALLSERSGWALRLPPCTLVFSSGRLAVTSARGAAGLDLEAPLDLLAGALGPAGGEVIRAQIPLWEGVRLVLHDNNPLSSLEAHPDKHGNLVDLGGQPAEAWVAALRQAFEVIDRELPTIAAEMRLLLRHVVPVGYFEREHLSASYLEAMGVVYMSLHPQGMTLVEALIHEFQHNKLNLLLGLDPTLENADWPLYTSPVRPDPRPLRGVLLAVHAFQPIVQLYEQLCAQPDRPDAAWLLRRRGEVARLCREGCDVLLPNGRPTALGASLMGEIRRLDETFARHVPHPQPLSGNTGEGGSPSVGG